MRKVLKLALNVALVAGMAWTVFVAYDVSAADPRASKRVCPSSLDIEYKRFDHCKTIASDAVYQFVAATCTMNEMMAVVCDGYGNNCYTGFIDAANF